MLTKRTKTDNLNLRRTPEVKPGNLIQALPLAHEVKVLDDTGGAWWEVETDWRGTMLRGFVYSLYLRDPLSSLKEALIGAAVEEWLRFDRGKGEETDPPYQSFVGEYWKSIGLDLDGDDTEQYWSAAFISFIVRKAGYGSLFKYSSAHWRYINDAIEKRQASDASSAFWGFQLNEHKPQLGDLICLWRERPVSFGSRPRGGFKSHCDLIVEVRDAEILTIGGNVSDSVSLKTLPLDSSGFLRSRSPLFAVLRNNK